MSRCARLKNDRRGAEPLSPLPSLTFNLSPRPLSFFLLFVLQPCILTYLTPENVSSLRLPQKAGPSSFLLYTFLFVPRLSTSLFQDSLDSPRDYVSCYYSSRRGGTPALRLFVFLLLPLQSFFVFFAVLSPLSWMCPFSPTYKYKTSPFLLPTRRPGGAD